MNKLWIVIEKTFCISSSEETEVAAVYQLSQEVARYITRVMGRYAEGYIGPPRPRLWVME